MIHYGSRQLLKDIFQLLKPYRARFIIATIIRFFGDLAWLYPAFALASIVTFITQYDAGDSLAPLWKVIGLWAGAIVIRSLSQFFTKSIGYGVAEKLAIDSAMKTIRHMFLLDMVWHERENSGNKIKRVQNAAEGLNNIIRLWFDNIIEILVNLVFINIIIASFDQKVLFILVFFLITYFIFSSVMTKRAGEASYRVNVQEEKVNGLFFEAINNIRTVKVMSMAKTLTDIFMKNVEDLFAKIRIRIFRYQSRYTFLSFWSYGFKIVIIVVIIRGILNGQYDLGFLVLFHTYFSNLRESIDELSTSTQDFVTSKFSIARMKDILNEPIAIDDEKGKGAFPNDWKKIAVNDLSFSYGKNTVLHHLSFEVRRGEKVGVVGLSGAGKSTLFKLLLKEREEFRGEILFDDIPIQTIRRSGYFERVSVVLQDTEVFNFSFRDNITMTNAERRKDQKLLQRSLDIAHISDFVQKLPQGLSTIIGEKGIKLSGGERQRLGIARAIFKEPQLLLLDEATSHLDLESEKKIQDSLHEFFENVTAIVIAHRLTTIREMDKILVIEDGKIIESGNFKELTAARGRFFELWQKQKF